MDIENKMAVKAQQVLESLVIPYVQNYYEAHKFNLDRNIFITSVKRKSVKGPYKLTNLERSNISEGCFEMICDKYFENGRPKILIIIRGEKFAWVKALSISHKCDLKLADFQAYYKLKKNRILSYYKTHPIDPDQNHWAVMMDGQKQIIGPLYLYEIENYIPDYIITYENVAIYETGTKINIHMIKKINENVVNYNYVHVIKK